MFKLRFPEKEIAEWASLNKDLGYLPFENVIGPAVAERGYMERREFLEMCRWKSPRTQSRCASNSESYIKEVTSVALSTQSEQLRIRVLTLLFGVSWPTASVILHFCSKQHYPILDFRAIWSLSVDRPPSYTFDFWWEYTEFCRALAKSHSLTMRDLDKALWQYSKVKQNT
nr:hypothetical protein [Halomonas elongata]